MLNKTSYLNNYKNKLTVSEHLIQYSVKYEVLSSLHQISSTIPLTALRPTDVKT